MKRISFILCLLILCIGCSKENDFKNAINDSFQNPDGSSIVGRYILISDTYNKLTNTFTYSAVLDNKGNEITDYNMLSNDASDATSDESGVNVIVAPTNFATSISNNLNNYNFLEKNGLIHIVNEKSYPVYIYSKTSIICDAPNVDTHCELDDNDTNIYKHSYIASKDYTYKVTTYKVTSLGLKDMVINNLDPSQNDNSFGLSIYYNPMVQSIDNYIEQGQSATVLYTIKYQSSSWYNNNKKYVDNSFNSYGIAANIRYPVISNMSITLYHGEKGWIVAAQ